DLNSRISLLESTIATLTQKLNGQGAAPNFVGTLLSKVQKQASTKGWTVRVTRQGSTRPVGTVLSQTPGAGTMLHYGSVINVVVANAPPKPKHTTPSSNSGRDSGLRS